MHLVLIRHGIAAERNGMPDAERPLTAKGIQRTRSVARALRGLGVAPDLALSSPLRRAVETAQIVARELRVGKLRTTNALAPGAAPEALLVQLAKLKVGSVLCAGHAPHLDLVIARAVAQVGSPLCELKKAGVACLDFEPQSKQALLLWMLPPSIARKLAKSPR